MAEPTPKAEPRLEERLRELTAQVAELEESTGHFQREASSGAHLIAQLEETLRVEEQARKQLAELVERQTKELALWRKEAAVQKTRAEEFEKKLAERLAAMREEQKRHQEALDSERQRILAELKGAVESAEAVRREGIEALEQARALKK